MIVSLKGEANSGKSAFALSFPGKVLVHEFDYGGFERAVTVHRDRQDAGDYVLKSYTPPLDNVRKNLGIKDETTQRLHGIRALWEQFIDDFCDGLEDSTVNSLSLDTFSKLYYLNAEALVELMQDEQELKGMKAGDKYRQQLLQIEYGKVNTRMNALFEAAANKGKNIILVHHMADTYGQVLNNGKVETAVTGRDAKGWKHCGFAAADLSDIVLQFTQETVDGKLVFRATFTKAPPALMGTYMDMPTYDDMVNRLKLVNG